jgi:hypothetical protein
MAFEDIAVAKGNVKKMKPRKKQRGGRDGLNRMKYVTPCHMQRVTVAQNR